MEARVEPSTSVSKVAAVDGFPKFVLFGTQMGGTSVLFSWNNSDDCGTQRGGIADAATGQATGRRFKGQRVGADCFEPLGSKTALELQTPNVERPSVQSASTKFSTAMSR